MKNKILALAALAETGTGVILLVRPAIVVRVLFGAEISGSGVLMSRLAGICLTAWVCPAGLGTQNSSR